MISKEDLDRYLQLMVRFKWTMTQIATDRTWDYQLMAVEWYCLQFRKLLEIIAFSSLVTNRDLLESHSKFSQGFKGWNSGGDILSKIGKINPAFYPTAVKLEHARDGFLVIREQPEDHALRKEKFKEIFKECSSVIHHRNPFDKELDMTEIDRISGLFKPWLSLIYERMKLHVIQPVNQEWLLVCILRDNNHSPLVIQAPTLDSFDTIDSAVEYAKRENLLNGQS